MYKNDIQQGSVYSNWYVLGRDFSIKAKYRYYLCHCSCGTLKSVSGHSLYSGASTSCGCKYALGKSRPRKSTYEDRALTHIISGYKAHAKQRKQVFDIDRQVFLGLIKKDCFWCGSPPSNRIRGDVVFHINGEEHKDFIFIYNGLDRINNDIGYTLNNVLPSCYVCNRARNNMTFEDFDQWIKNLISFHSEGV
jgi:hypothetical protein